MDAETRRRLEAALACAYKNDPCAVEQADVRALLAALPAEPPDLDVAQRVWARAIACIEDGATPTLHDEMTCRVMRAVADGLRRRTPDGMPRVEAPDGR